jgi:hypothetical protein
MKQRQPGDNDLAQEVYSHLPRELRNHVYAFCVEGSYDNEVGQPCRPILSPHQRTFVPAIVPMD